MEVKDFLEKVDKEIQKRKEEESKRKKKEADKIELLKALSERSIAEEITIALFKEDDDGRLIDALNISPNGIQLLNLIETSRKGKEVWDPPIIITTHQLESRVSTILEWALEGAVGEIRLKIY